MYIPKMKELVHTLKFPPTWKLMDLVSKIDRFDANWSSIEKREGVTLKQLKSIATVSSVGASTRIEGVQMSNNEIDHLISNVNTEKLEERDKQEVIGYFDALDLISESYPNINIIEGDLKNLHKVLLKHSDKDQWHKGNYKKQSNAVEAEYPDGSKTVIFQTAEPGLETEEAMRSLMDWYKKDKTTHKLVKCAIFAYEFLSIHPFQDGNGRLSRLLSSLLLMQSGYVWIQYVSFEHEIENRKAQYYSTLRSCQANRPGEDVTDWVMFFLDALLSIQGKLTNKLDTKGQETKLTTDERSVYLHIQNKPGVSASSIREALGYKKSKLTSILAQLLEVHKIIDTEGTGKSLKYILR